MGLCNLISLLSQPKQAVFNCFNTFDEDILHTIDMAPDRRNQSCKLCRDVEFYCGNQTEEIVFDDVTKCDAVAKRVIQQMTLQKSY